MSPARREAVFWEADAAIGVATAETAAPDATSRRVKVPGLISGNESQFFCERAAVFAATATSKMRRGILLCGSQLMGLPAPKDWTRHSPGVSLSHARTPNNHGSARVARWQQSVLVHRHTNLREFSAKRRAIRNRGASRVPVQPLGTRSPSSSQPASIRDAAAAPPEFEAQRQQPHKTCSRAQRDRSCWSKAPRPRLREAAPPCPPWAQPRGARNSCGHRWRHVAPSP